MAERTAQLLDAQAVNLDVVDVRVHALMFLCCIR